MTAIIRTENLPAGTAFEIEVRDVLITGRMRSEADSSNWTREGKKTSRVYGALDALVPELLRLEPFTGNYGDDQYDIPIKEDPARTVEDDVRSAMYDGWKRATLKVAGERLVSLLQVAFAGTAWAYEGDAPRFSQTAGCSCPCSPGFVLPTRIRLGQRNVDLHIETIPASSVVEETPAS